MTDEEAKQLPVQLEAATLDAFGSSTWMTDAGPLDLLVDLRDRGGGRHDYGDLLQRSVRYQVDDLTVVLASLDDIIASKELAGREKDREGLPELLEIRRQRLHTTGTSAHRGTTCRRLPVTLVRLRRRLARPNAPTTHGTIPANVVAAPPSTLGIRPPLEASHSPPALGCRRRRPTIGPPCNGFCPLLAHWEDRTGHNRAQHGGTRAFPGQASDQGKSPAQTV